MYPLITRVAGAEGPSNGLDGDTAGEEACPGGGHTPNMDDDVPQSQIIRLGSQSSAGPTRPLPTFRGKGEVSIEDLDNSSSEDDDMSSRFKGLAGGPSYEPSGCLRAKPMINDPLLRKDQRSGKGTQKPTWGSVSAMGQRAMEVVCKRLDRAFPIMDNELHELGDSEPKRLSSIGLQELA
uniref:Uncharacterized protein n=1 Tax=Cannabis sativa TaxID=3483 RepID=A0A803QNS8_CANSA